MKALCDSVSLWQDLSLENRIPAQKVTDMKKRFNVLALLIFCSFVGAFLSGCAPSTPPKLTPETAKQFLKLRGYNYDEGSFHGAVKAKDVAAVNAFLAAGMNPNVKEPISQAAPLIASSARGDIEIVRTLLNARAEVNAKDRGGYTPILRALEKSNLEIADLLLARPEIDLNAQGASGVTVLMQYVGLNNDEMVRKVLDRGANVDLQDSDGDTSLHRAAQSGNVKILDLLLARGAKPDVKNKVGGTPLMWAAVFGHQDAARALLEKGADPSLKDNQGRTASDWAIENKRDEVAQLLQTAEKK